MSKLDVDGGTTDQAQIAVPPLTQIWRLICNTTSCHMRATAASWFSCKCHYTLLQCAQAAATSTCYSTPCQETNANRAVFTVAAEHRTPCALTGHSAVGTHNLATQRRLQDASQYSVAIFSTAGILMTLPLSTPTLLLHARSMNIVCVPWHVCA